VVRWGVASDIDVASVGGKREALLSYRTKDFDFLQLIAVGDIR